MNLDKIIVPMIRQTFPKLITSQLVGVQPMSGDKFETKWVKVFLWKPAKVSNKWRWLIYANEKFQRRTMGLIFFYSSKSPDYQWKSCGYFNNEDMFLESL